MSKKSFADVAHLLDRAKRPTRLTFVRHACGRRFVSRDKDTSCATAAGEVSGRNVFGLRRRGKRGKAGRGYEQLLCAGSARRVEPRCSSISPQKATKCYRQIEVGAVRSGFFRHGMLPEIGDMWGYALSCWKKLKLCCCRNIISTSC